MEFIVGILELIIRGGTEVGKNKEYSKWIRYPLLLLVGIVYFGLIAVFIFIGFSILEDGLCQQEVYSLFRKGEIISCRINLSRV